MHSEEMRVRLACGVQVHGWHASRRCGLDRRGDVPMDHAATSRCLEGLVTMRWLGDHAVAPEDSDRMIVRWRRAAEGLGPRRSRERHGRSNPGIKAASTRGSLMDLRGKPSGGVDVDRVWESLGVGGRTRGPPSSGVDVGQVWERAWACKVGHVAS